MVLKEANNKTKDVQFWRKKKNLDPLSTFDYLIIEYFWVFKGRDNFQFAHMLNTKDKEYSISNKHLWNYGCLTSKKWKHSKIYKMEIYDSLSSVINIHSFIYISNNHPSIHPYLLSAADGKVLFWVLIDTMCDG